MAENESREWQPPVVNQPNPGWIRDEIILALELYYRYRPGAPPKHGSEIHSLSELLRRIGVALYGRISNTYRNPNGVYLKVSNFRALDPAYQGAGMSSVSRLDREIWEEFADKAAELSEAAETIRKAFSVIESEGR